MHDVVAAILYRDDSTTNGTTTPSPWTWFRVYLELRRGSHHGLRIMSGVTALGRGINPLLRGWWCYWARCSKHMIDVVASILYRDDFSLPMKQQPHRHPELDSGSIGSRNKSAATKFVILNLIQDLSRTTMLLSPWPPDHVRSDGLRSRNKSAATGLVVLLGSMLETHDRCRSSDFISRWF